jgi:mono/diheme cytochrome c family protein
MALIFVSACSPRRGEPLTGPLTLNEEQQRGHVLYDRHCYKCHQEGEGGMSPKFNEKPLPKFLMRFQIRHGLGAMPAFPPERLSDQDVHDIVEYLVALRRHPAS